MPFYSKKVGKCSEKTPLLWTWPKGRIGKQTGNKSLANIFSLVHICEINRGPERAPGPWDAYSQEGDGPASRYVVVSGREQCLGLKGSSKRKQKLWKWIKSMFGLCLRVLFFCHWAAALEHSRRTMLFFLVWVSVSSSFTHYLQPQKNQTLSERFTGNQLGGLLQAHYHPCSFLHL